MRYLRIALAALGVTFITAEATFAADLPVEPLEYRPPVRVVSYGWTGFYVGGNVGAAWGQSDDPTSTVVGGYFGVPNGQAINAVGAQTTKSNGAIGGIQAGFNWQAGHFLAGVEVDFNYFGLRGSNTANGLYPAFAPAGFTIASSVSTNWLATFRGRVGLAWENWLFYGTGGLALATLKGDFTFSDNCAAVGGCPVAANAFETKSLSEMKIGYAVGAGVEVGITDRWTVKAEYLYVSFGKVSGTEYITTPALAALTANNPFLHEYDLQSHILRIGFNYLFAL